MRVWVMYTSQRIDDFRFESALIYDIIQEKINKLVKRVKRLVLFECSICLEHDVATAD